MTKPITGDDMRRSLDLHDLLQVCHAAAEHLGQKVEKDREIQSLPAPCQVRLP